MRCCLSLWNSAGEDSSGLLIVGFSASEGAAGEIVYSRFLFGITFLWCSTGEILTFGKYWRLPPVHTAVEGIAKNYLCLGCR